MSDRPSLIPDAVWRAVGAAGLCNGRYVQSDRAVAMICSAWTGSSSTKAPAGAAHDCPRHSGPAPSGSAMAHFGWQRLRAPGALLAAHGVARRSGLRVCHPMDHDQRQKALGG
eukprot:COSAG04_NODE_524_length_13127_cov_18.191511_15_plen_113_part_00